MPVLVDTGILLRVFSKADPHCGPIRTALVQLRRQNEELVVASQNVAEFFNVSTRPIAARGGYGHPVKTVQARVSFIERLCLRVAEDDDAYQQWKNLVSKYNVTGVAVHDARLVAIMLTHGIKRVLTINDRDFRRYEPEGISILTPQEVIVRHSMKADEPLSPEELILRDHLALDRTRLANERTLLAYLRTALMMLVAGASAVKFVGESHDVIVTGWLFIVLAFVVAIIGAWRFLAMRRSINGKRGLIKPRTNG